MKFNSKGPCFHLNDSVRIVYEHKIQIGCHVISESYASCIVPYLDRVGRIPIELIVNSVHTFKGWLNTKEKINNYDLNGFKPFYFHSELNNSINLTWNAEFELSDTNEKYSLVLSWIDEQTKLNNFILVEPDLSESKFKFIRFSDYIETNFNETFYYIMIVNTNKANNSHINSVKFASRIDFLDDLNADKICNEWYVFQPNPIAYLESLPPCPRHISIDFPDVLLLDSFTEDVFCNKNNHELCDIFHQGNSFK